MKYLDVSLSVIHRFRKVWEGWIEPAWIGDAKARHLSRVLNIILLFLLIWGFIFEVQSSLDSQIPSAGMIHAFLMMGVLVLAYFLNRSGHFTTATILTIVLLITSTLVSALVQQSAGTEDLSVLYFLILPILLGELFLSMRGYLVMAIIILGGVFGFSLLNSSIETIFGFLLVFCMLIGFTSYNRRTLEWKQITLASEAAREQSLLFMEQRRTARLSLLQEAGRQIMDSLDEREILERTLQELVSRFGYPQAVIAMLVEGDILESVAISGTRDYGFREGFRQKIGEGVIGHVAETHESHLVSDVSQDPYYFSNAERSGSALGVPMLDNEQLLGVIYIESATKNELQADDVQTLQTLANQVATALEKARLYARTQEHLQVMTTLQSISRAVTSSLELDDILNKVIKLLKDSLGYTYISIYLLDDNVLRLGAQVGFPDNMIIHGIPVTLGVMGRTARSQQTQFIRDVDKDPDFIRASYEVKSEIAVPLLRDEHVIGVLNVESKDDEALDENDVNFLNALAGSLAIAIDNARLHSEVKRMALTDVISGLANRRAFDEILQAELTRASRYNQWVSLIILDLDSFKEYNDKWGHPAGDVRLIEVADILRVNVREPDVAARYGGEEFAIILPNTSKSGAIQLAERLRHAAESSAPYKNNNRGPISGYTISLGVATYPDDAETIEELLLAADNAELTAKRLGKNQVYAVNVTNRIQNT